MRKQLTALLLIVTFSCSKSNNAPETITCLTENYPSWLIEQLKSYSSCVCDPAYLAGTHNGQVVYVATTTSAVCCGIDMIYDSKGKALFNTMTEEEYKKFRAEITGLHEIWRCSKTTTTTL